MDTPTILAIASCLLILIFVWRMSIRRLPKMPFSRCGSLLTAGELRFYKMLLQCVPKGLTVFVKVRLMDLVSVPDYAWREYGAKGSGMHLDFVLADANTLLPCLVIELDDKSHWRPDVRERDAFKDAALESAGLPMLRVTAAGRYDAAAIRGQIASALA